MRTILILRGLPGSGKSTLAAFTVAQEPLRWIRVSRDDIRGMFSGPGNNPYHMDTAWEKLVDDVKLLVGRMALVHGFNVVADSTHLKPEEVQGWHDLAEELHDAGYGKIKVIERWVKMDLDECLRRNAGRSGFARLDESIIRRMAERIEGLGELVDRVSFYPATNSST